MTHPAIALLLAVQPRPLAAADLLARLYAEALASIDELLAIQDEIEAVISEADQLASRSESAVKRCMELKPTPTPQAPLGF